MFPEDREDNLLYSDELLFANTYTLEWGTVPHSSLSQPEWKEIIFPVNPETVENVASVPVMIDRYVDRIPGQWKVEIPLRLVRNAK